MEIFAGKSSALTCVRHIALLMLIALLVVGLNVTVLGQNLVQNPGFENGYSGSGATGVFTSWTNYANASTRCRWDNAYSSIKRSGTSSASLRIGGSGTNDASFGIYQQIPVTNGMQYTFTCYVRTTFNNSMWAEVICYNKQAVKADIDTTTANLVAAGALKWKRDSWGGVSNIPPKPASANLPTVVSSGETDYWERVNFTVTGTSTGYVTIAFKWGASGGPIDNPTLYIDDVSLIPACTPPVTPTIGTAVANSSSQITWGWTVVPSLTGEVYKVYDAASGGNLKATSDTDAASVVETGLSPNTQYTRWVSTLKNCESTTRLALPAKYTLANTPGAPTVGSPTATTINVTANATAESPVNPATTQYAVTITGGAYGTTDGVYWVPANGGVPTTSAAWQAKSSWTTKTVSGLATSTTYTFKVKAKNGDGLETTNFSNAASTATGCTPPAAPTGGTATANSVSQITWGWTVVPSVSGEVYRIYDAATGGILKATSAADAASVAETGLSPNTQYTRWVSAFKDCESTTRLALPVKYTLANVPGVPVVDGVTNTTMDVAINPNSNPANTTYAIKVVEGTNTSYVQANGTLGATDVWQIESVWESTGGKKTVTGLAQGTTYVVSVAARNGDNVVTSYSTTASATTLQLTPLGPDTGYTEIIDCSSVAMPEYWNGAYGNGTKFSTTTYSSGMTTELGGSCIKGTAPAGSSWWMQKRMQLKPNATGKIKVWMAVPAGNSGHWVETGFKVGAENNFDTQSSTWTMIKKFDDWGLGADNGGVWTQYEANVTTNANGWINIGIKVGGANATAYWDCISVQNTLLDLEPPAVTIDQAAGQDDPTTSPTVNFTVVFNEPVTGFDANDVVITGTAGGTKTVTITGTGPTYNVAVSGMTSSGTVIASIAAGAALDSFNNQSLASTSTDNEVTYNYVTLPNAPASPIASDISTGSIRWAWTDNSDDETGFKVYAGPGAAAPAEVTDTTAANATYWDHTGLTANAQYAFQVAATNSMGDSAKTANITAWTLANTPSAPVVDGPSADSLTVAIGSGDGNPATTQYAIQISPALGGDSWVQPNGTVGSTEAWKTAAEWGTVTVSTLDSSTEYTFKAKARNSVDVETALSAGAVGTTCYGDEMLVNGELNRAFTGGGFCQTNPGAFAGWTLVSGQTWYDDNKLKANSMGCSNPANPVITQSFGMTTGSKCYTASFEMRHDNHPDTGAWSKGWGKMTVYYYTDSSMTVPCNPASDTTGNIANATNLDWYTIKLVKNTPADCRFVKVEVTSHSEQFNGGFGFTDVDGVSFKTDGSAACSAPAISASPANQVVCAGAGVLFSVTATGTAPLSYQWRKGGNVISGANTADYTIISTAPGDAGSYDCVVSNACGSAVSAAATLTVNVGPSITVQPASQTTCAGQSVTFSVSAAGTAPLSYQWKKDNIDIAGAKLASYVATDAGSYTCVVSNDCGMVTSNAAVLTVAAKPAVVSITPSTTGPTSDDSVAFTVVFSDAVTGFAEAADVTVNHSGTAHTAVAIQANSAASYTVTVSGITGDGSLSLGVNADASQSTAGCGNTAFGPSAAVVIDNSAPYVLNVTSEKVDGTYGVDEVVDVRVVMSEPVTVDTANGSPVLTMETGEVDRDAVYISGSGTDTLVFEYVVHQGDASPDLDYTATDALVLNGAVIEDNCGNVADMTLAQPGTTGSLASNKAIVIETCVPPVITLDPVGAAVCFGQTAIFTVEATGTAPLSYQWKKNGAEISGAVSDSYEAAEAGSYTCVVSNDCGSDESEAAVLVVNTAPAIITQPLGQTVCSGSTATFTVAASGTAPLSYQWYKDTVLIDGAESADYTTDIAGTYTCTVTNGCGSATSETATLTVNSAPEIVVQPMDMTICEGGTAVFSIIADGTAPLAYQWKKNGVAIADAETTEYAATEAGSYTCVVSNGCGMVTSDAAVLTVGTHPAVVSITPSVTGPTSADSVDFTVVFSEPVTGFTEAGDVTVNHSGTAHAAVAIQSVSETSYTVTMSGITGDGSMSLSVNEDAAQNTTVGCGSIAGGPSAAVVIDNTAPTTPTLTLDREFTSSTDVNATFGGSIDTNGVEYKLKLDDGAFEAAISPSVISAAGLSEGLHTVTVIAVDPAENASSEATASFTVDKTNPEASIVSILQTEDCELMMPSDYVANQGEVAIFFTADDINLDGTPIVTVKDAANSDITVAPVTFNEGYYRAVATIDATTANGAATVTITAVDKAGNTVTDTAQFGVNKAQIVLDVELKQVVSGPLARCITFRLGNGLQAYEMPQVVEFNDGVAQVVLKNIPYDKAWTCISAKDRLHTLRRTVALSGGENDQFSGDMTGVSALVGGDLNNDNKIDIIDFGAFVGQYGRTLAPVFCDFIGRHPDISGNGTVGTDDFTFIQTGFLTMGDYDCQGTVLTSLPRTAVTVAMARAAGVAEAEAADVNRDGMIDLKDVAIWTQLNMSRGK